MALTAEYFGKIIDKWVVEELVANYKLKTSLILHPLYSSQAKCYWSVFITHIILLAEYTKWFEQTFKVNLKTRTVY